MKYTHTLEAKIKISKAQLGNKHALGHSHTPESKVKIGNASRGNKYNLGKKRSEEAKRKTSLALKGHPNFTTPEGNKKISATIKKLWENPEYRERMRQAHLGYKHTEQQKSRISITNRLFFDSLEGIEAKKKIRQSTLRRFENPEARLKVSR